MSCKGGLGKWRPVARKGGRREQLRRCGSQCFLKPTAEKPGYPVCPPDSCTPTCEGAYRARQRAVTQRDYATERKAVMLGKRLGCSWAAGAVAKRGRGRKQRKAA